MQTYRRATELYLNYDSAEKADGNRVPQLLARRVDYNAAQCLSESSVNQAVSQVAGRGVMRRAACAPSGYHLLARGPRQVIDVARRFDPSIGLG